jgi:hypothetical protein
MRSTYIHTIIFSWIKIGVELSGGIHHPARYQVTEASPEHHLQFLLVLDRSHA